MPKLYIEVYGEKYPGREQEPNEDSVFCVSAGTTSKMSADMLAVLGVADGTGGAPAGVVASTVATEYLTYLFVKGGYQTIAEQRGFPGMDYTALINETFNVLNRKIRERAGLVNGKGPIGTTCVFGLITYNAPDDKTYLQVGNVGNSRSYIIRGDQIFHATDDDSHAWQLYKKGEITYADMLVHPLRHVSTTIGMKETIAPQVHSIELLANDIVLFCTDGMHESIDDPEIEFVINSSANTREAVTKLVTAAKAAGSKDDIAVALAYCSATPIEVNAGFDGGLNAAGWTKHKKAIIGIWSAAAVLFLAALAAYFWNPGGSELPSMPVAVRIPEDMLHTTAAESISVAATGRQEAAAVEKPGPAAAEKSAVTERANTEIRRPEMSVEWISETKRFRIKVKGSGAIPVSLSYGGVSFDVVAVKSIPNLYKTTLPAEAETLPKKRIVTIRVKGRTTAAVHAGFTMIE